MKDIEINTSFKRFLYGISWSGFICLGFLLSWIIAIALYSYGRDTMENKKKVKGVINMTYQKWIWIYGIIFGSVLVVGFVVSIVQLQLGMWNVLNFIKVWSIPVVIFLAAFFIVGTANIQRGKPKHYFKTTSSNNLKDIP